MSLNSRSGGRSRASTMFTHLHVRSWFSFLAGGSAPEDYVNRACEMGMKRLALTDVNGVYGVVRFQQVCRDAGIRPIFGAEVHVATGPPTSDLRPPTSALRSPTSDLRLPTSALRSPTSALPPPPSALRSPSCDLSPHTSALRPPTRPCAPPPASRAPRSPPPALRPPPSPLRSPTSPLRLPTPALRSPARPSSEHRLVLLAASGAGYANLCRILTAAHLRDRDHPHALLEELAEHREDLFCLTGTYDSRLWALLDGGRFESARRWVESLAQIFGDRLSIEVAHHLLPGDKRRLQRLKALSDRTGVPLAATGDVRYAMPDHYKRYDLMTCIRHGITVFEPHPDRPRNAEAYLKDEAAMRKLIPWPEAFDRTE